MVVLEVLDKAAAARCARFRAWGGEKQGFHSEWAMHTLRAANRASKSSTTFVGSPLTFDSLSPDERRLEFLDDDLGFVHPGLFSRSFKLLQTVVLSW